MSIQFACDNPDCGRSLRVKNDLAGKHIKCPDCCKALVVPTSEDLAGPGPSAKRRARAEHSRGEEVPQVDEDAQADDASEPEAALSVSARGAWIEPAVLGAVVLATLGAVAVVGWWVYHLVGGGDGGLVAGAVAALLGALVSFKLLSLVLVKRLEGKVWWLKYRLRSSWDDVRVAAIQKLARLDGKQVQDLLLAHASDKNGRVREAVYKALGNFKSSRACEVLVAGAQDRDFLVRVAVYEVLGKFTGSRARAALLAGVQDEDCFVRVAVYRALGQVKDPRARDVLLARLDDPDGTAQDAAVAALKASPDPLARARVKQWLKDRAGRAKAEEARAKEVEVRVVCSGCGRDYVLGKNASVVTPEELQQYRAQHGTVILSGGPITSEPDVIGPAAPLDAAKDPGTQTILQARARGASRRWRCESCGSVQSYAW